MKEKLFNAVTNIDDALILEAEKPLKKDRKTIYLRALSCAACFVIVVMSALDVLGRYEYLGFGCSSWPGDIVEGKYYYTENHKGIYCYDPENKTSQKLLSTFWYDDYIVEADGIYYTSSNKLSFLDFETGKREKIYKAWFFSHIRIDSISDDEVEIVCYQRLFRKKKKLLIDKETGEVKEVIRPLMSFDEYNDMDEDNIKVKLNDRELTIKKSPESYEAAGCILLEKGENILPPDIFVSPYRWNIHPSPSKDKFFIDGSRYFDDNLEPVTVIISDDSVKVIDTPEFNDMIFLDDFILYLKDEELFALSLDDEKERKIEVNGKSNIGLYSIASDGNYLYTTVPWSDIHEVWKIEKDENGMPKSISLYDEDVK